MEKLIIRNTCSVKCTIEMNVVATSASIAIVISFINKIEKMLTNDKTAIPRIKRQNN